MIKNFSLEERIRIKTRINQILIFLVGFIAAFGIYKIKLLNDNYIPWVVSIIVLAVLSMALMEVLRNWAYNDISDYIYDAVYRASSKSDEIMKETCVQEGFANKHISLLKESSAAIEKLKKSSLKTKQSSQEVAQNSQKSLDLSSKEQNSVEQNIEKMNTLKQKIEIIAELILELSEHTQQIGSIIGVVEDITEQTNMLALNAAVEAARAGEHGKGFAVVASEIRKLADESKQATAKITSLIYDIQQATNSTVMATEEGTKEIESGVDLAHQIAQNIEKLKSTIQETVNSVELILKDIDNQIDGAGEVNTLIERLDVGLSESSEKIKSTMISLNELKETSETLRSNIIGIEHNSRDMVKNVKSYK